MKKIVGIGLLLLIAVIIGSRTARADLTATQNVTAFEGTYIDPGFPDLNNDQKLLFVSEGGTGPAQITLLKFNLGGVSFPINKARLNLAQINPGIPCGVAVNALDEINLYDTTDGWSEAVVTYTTRPARGSLLDDMDQSVVDPNGRALTWTDDTGIDNLASYLETERQGDGIASIWVETASTVTGNVVFEDDEATGVNFIPAPCPGSAYIPTLQLSDAVDPLAVTMSTLTSSGQAKSIWTLSLAVFLLLAATGYVLLARWHNRL